jgi:anti-anti-sigma factor
MHGFGIETSSSDGVRTITVTGELDSATCRELVEAFERVLSEPEAGTSVSLDLEAVSFIDSSGMRAMIQLERRAAELGVTLALNPPPDDVTELLRTAGIAERMNVPSVSDGQLGPDFLDRIELELPCEPAAPSRARGEVREALATRLSDGDVATIVLLTSELVTNAVLHGSGPDTPTVGLSISVYEDGVRVEVEDSGEGFDPAAPGPSSRHGGRGLFLVEQCAASWGAQRHDGRRFCVWFEFLSGDREAAAVGG